MKNYPYGIKYIAEIKEYKKLCRNKKGKYANYLKWKKHIIELIDSFDVITLENFRHYCLYNEEIDVHGMNIFLPIAISFTALCVPLNMKSDNELISNLSILVVVAIVTSIIITWAYFDYIFSKNFYHDVALIVKEKIESLPKEEQLLIKIESDNKNNLLTSDKLNAEI